jgi:hypothetical protein
MSEAPRPEPEWVQRMRAAGYNIRVGSGEPMSEIPDAMFDPPVSRGTRIRGRIFIALRSLFRLQLSTRRATHAPLP